MRFLDVIRGSRCAAPSKLLPVMKMPLMTRVKSEIGLCRLMLLKYGYLPCCPEHRQANAKSDAQCTPEVRGDIHKQKTQILPVDQGAADRQHISSRRHGFRSVVCTISSRPLVTPVGTGQQRKRGFLKLCRNLRREQHTLSPNARCRMQ